MSDVSNIQGLAILPSEVLLHILALLETQHLLPLTLVSQRFHLLILRILHARVLLAAPPLGFELILECYRPAAKYTEPPLDCEYLGTDGLEDILTDDVLETGNLGGRLRKINGLYSRFRPYRRADPKPRRHPAGDIPGSRTYARSTQAQQQQQQQAQSDAQSSQTVTYPRPQAPERDIDAVAPEVNSSNDSSNEAASSAAAANAPELPAAVILPVHLDGSELFTQLCAHTTLVVPGPKKGIYRTTAPVHDCIIRVWRHWLAKEAQAALDAEGNVEIPNDNAGEAKGKGKASSGSSSSIVNERGILWSNKSREICMRFKVRERTWRRATGGGGGEGTQHTPQINAALAYGHIDSDELPITYELEFQELLVRTSHILFKMEEARTRLHDSTGKAMVFGQFNS